LLLDCQKFVESNVEFANRPETVDGAKGAD